MTVHTQGDFTRRPGGTVALSDLYGAAFLVARSHRVLRVEPVDSRRRTFIFAADERIEQDYLDFANNAQVGVQELISAVYVLKRLLKGMH